MDLPRLFDARRRTLAAGTARFRYVRLDVAITVECEGILDFRVRGGRWQLANSLGTEPPWECICDGRAMYHRPVDEERWTKWTDADGYESLSGDYFGMLDLLPGAVADPVAAGREIVRGARTDSYVVTVEAGKARDAASPGAVILPGAPSSARVPVRVSVDSEGLIRRIAHPPVIDEELVAALRGPGMSAPAGAAPDEQRDRSLTLDLWDFGVPVNVDPPAGPMEEIVFPGPYPEEG